MNARILLVEDNPLTAKGLQYLLEHERNTVEVAPDAASALVQLGQGTYDLALLDVSLPDSNGFELAKRLRDTVSDLPIIFLTARDDEADVVRGLELGAEDYVTKPFRNRELLSRINNALKRHGKASTLLQVGNLTFDPATEIVKQDDSEVNLTALERRILWRLMENAGSIVTRTRLLDEIWDASGSIVNDNTLSVYLKRLRQKLGDVVTIETIKNMGYRLRKEN